MMSMDAASTASFGPFEQLRYAREIIRAEADALLAMSERLQTDFNAAIDLLVNCRGSVIVSGMGKAGLIGQKIAATLASTGTRSHFLHPAEAVHGDLGRVHADDLMLVLSFSGETGEVVDLMPSLRGFATPIIAITGKPNSTLARGANVTLNLGPISEAGSLGLAPSTSTTAMLALGDALALVASRIRGFGREDFARFHPGGSLGRKLAKVDEVMRPLSQCRVAGESKTVRDILVELGQPGRRTGAIMTVDSQGKLSGIFTDSDLARLLENNRDDALDGPLTDVMTCSPKTVEVDRRMSEARSLMAENKISELPVVDAAGKPVGLIDITDVVDADACQPASSESAEFAAPGANSANSHPVVEPATVPFRNKENPPRTTS